MYHPLNLKFTSDSSTSVFHKWDQFRSLFLQFKIAQLKLKFVVFINLARSSIRVVAELAFMEFYFYSVWIKNQPTISLHTVKLFFLLLWLYDIIEHKLLFFRSGAVFGFGKNINGQLGLQDRDNRCYPTHLKSLRNVKVINY